MNGPKLSTVFSQRTETRSTRSTSTVFSSVQNRPHTVLVVPSDQKAPDKPSYAPLLTIPKLMVALPAVTSTTKIGNAQDLRFAVCPSALGRITHDLIRQFGKQPVLLICLLFHIIRRQIEHTPLAAIPSAVRSHRQVLAMGKGTSTDKALLLAAFLRLLNIETKLLVVTNKAGKTHVLVDAHLPVTSSDFCAGVRDFYRMPSHAGIYYNPIMEKLGVTLDPTFGNFPGDAQSTAEAGFGSIYPNAEGSTSYRHGATTTVPIQ